MSMQIYADINNSLVKWFTATIYARCGSGRMMFLILGLSACTHISCIQNSDTSLFSWNCQLARFHNHSRKFAILIRTVFHESSQKFPIIDTSFRVLCHRNSWDFMVIHGNSWQRHTLHSKFNVAVYHQLWVKNHERPRKTVQINIANFRELSRNFMEIDGTQLSNVAKNGESSR